MRLIFIFFLIVVSLFWLSARFAERSSFAHTSSYKPNKENTTPISSPSLVAAEKTEYLSNLRNSAMEARFIGTMPYQAELIEQALANSDTGFGAFSSRVIDRKIPNRRIMEEVIQGGEVNVFWGPALAEFDRRELFKINIPLVRGLQGCKIFLIRDDDQATFDHMNDPKGILFGLGNGWPETDIFEYNGLDFLTAVDHEALFYTLSAGRYDAVPYGADFVYKRLMASRNFVDNLTLEKNHTLYYPMPVIFYVNHKFPALAAALEDGLRKLQKNGVMEQIFLKHNRDVFSFLHLHKRSLFTIENPLLSPDAPVIKNPCQL